MINRRYKKVSKKHIISIQSTKATMLANKKQRWKKKPKNKCEQLFSLSRPPIDDPTSENEESKFAGKNRPDPTHNEFVIAIKKMQSSRCANLAMFFCLLSSLFVCCRVFLVQQASNYDPNLTIFIKWDIMGLHKLCFDCR